MIVRKPIFPNVIELNIQAGHLIGCNVYLIYDADEWVLLDIGYKDHVEEIIDLIRELDFPLSQCCLTANCCQYTTDCYSF